MINPIKEEKLYIGNLHFSVTEGDLIKVFSDIGKIKTVNYVWHFTGPQRGMPRGFAFLEFEDPRCCEIAISKLNNQMLRGKKIVVKYSNPDTNAAQQPAPASSLRPKRKFDDETLRSNKVSCGAAAGSGKKGVDYQIRRIQESLANKLKKTDS